MRIKMATYAILGNGSFATALCKILTHGNHNIRWWMRSEQARQCLNTNKHNLQYLTQVDFGDYPLFISNDINETITEADHVLVAVPSAFVLNVLGTVDAGVWHKKKFVSAIKGIVPGYNIVLNEYLELVMHIDPSQYCCITGPCHAEEIAAEKLSYLTFASENEVLAKEVASHFATDFLRTVVGTDVYGVQYAAILKNIYALGAGIASGLGYGDNFLSVYNTNCFAEMQQFMMKYATVNQHLNVPHHYITSAYMGDLLVTSYSQHSRNRAFGAMLGKGRTIEQAKVELNMVAEGYYATKCVYEINTAIKAYTPILEQVYQILWQNKPAADAFATIEHCLQ
jgi:glycerol-3-phosphate dehydrogenase (NAD(P)+)